MMNTERVTDDYVEGLLPLIERAGHFTVNLYAGNALPWDSQRVLNSPDVLTMYQRCLPLLVENATICRLYRGFRDSTDVMDHARLLKTGRTLAVDIKNPSIGLDPQFWWSVGRSGHTASFVFVSERFPAESLFRGATDPAFVSNCGVGIGSSALRFARRVVAEGKVAILLSGTADTIDGTVVASRETIGELFRHAARFCGVWTTLKCFRRQVIEDVQERP